MEKIGYVFSSLDSPYIEKQLSIIRSFGIKKIIIDEEELNSLKRGDELVIYELKSLGKSITQLAKFLVYLDKKDVKLTIISKNYDYDEISNRQMFNLIAELADMESFVISDRTTKGIKNARRSGRIGGRPKISDETIEKIQHLYHNQSYTLRKIAEECNVSLGTAYKYIQE
ncbi:MAG: recombinase family protein [Vagococcus fluvialis]